MKVLHIGPKNFPPCHGGVERVVYDLARFMPDVQSHVLIEWPQDRLPDRVRLLPKGLMRQFRMARDYAVENSIDIIHVHKEAFLPLGLLLKMSGLKCVATIHGCPWRLARWPLAIRAAFFALDCLASCCLDRTVFVGLYDWRLFAKLFPRGRTAFVPNGVEVSLEPSPDRRSGSVYLGRLSPEKNIAALAKAADQAHVRLDLYGPFDRRDKALREELLSLVTTSKWITWHGPVPADQVRNVLRRYKIFMNASLAEGMPVSVLEAAAEGLHLVLSDIPQHRTLQMPGCTYVDARKIDLRRLPTNGQAGGEQNRAHVAGNFSISNTVKAYRDIYRKIML